MILYINKNSFYILIKQGEKYELKRKNRKIYTI